MSDPRADSVRARLLNRARANGEVFNQLLTRYALERWLYRLSVSDQKARFVLKGALLFSLWFDVRTAPRVMQIFWVTAMRIWTSCVNTSKAFALLHAMTECISIPHRCG